MFWRRPKGDFVVTLWLDGRHPYLRSTALDLPSRYVKVNVKARSFNHAERVAFETLRAMGHLSWSTHVRAITRL